MSEGIRHDRTQALCIGGPCDGRILGVTEADRERVKLHVPVSPIRYASDCPPEPAGTAFYQKQRIKTYEGELTCWVPEGQTVLATLRILLDHYAATKAGAP